jgi:hypothetical protein
MHPDMPTALTLLAISTGAQFESHLEDTGTEGRTSVASTIYDASMEPTPAPPVADHPLGSRPKPREHHAFKKLPLYKEYSRLMEEYDLLLSDATQDQSRIAFISRRMEHIVEEYALLTKKSDHVAKRKSGLEKAREASHVEIDFETVRKRLAVENLPTSRTIQKTASQISNVTTHA